MKFFGGVDPGKKGAIVTINENRMLMDAFDMPDTDSALFDALDAICRSWDPFFFIERVWGNPIWGGRHNFEFGRQKGRAEMGLTASQIRWHSVPPTTWQRFFDLYKTTTERGKGGQKKWKERLRKFACKIFGMDVPIDQADAFLLAEYSKENMR